MRRLFAARSIAADFAAVSASPANAADNESGTQYCQSGYTPRADASAIGNLYLKGPGDASYAYFYISGSNFRPGPTWAVAGTGVPTSVDPVR